MIGKCSIWNIKEYLFNEKYIFKIIYNKKFKKNIMKHVEHS